MPPPTTGTEAEDSALDYYERQRPALESLCSRLMDAVISTQPERPEECMLKTLLDTSMSQDSLRNLCIDTAWRSSRRQLEATVASADWSFQLDENLQASTTTSMLSSSRWAHFAERGHAAEAEAALQLHGRARDAH